MASDNGIIHSAECRVVTSETNIHINNNYVVFKEP